MYLRLELGDKDKFESTGEVIRFNGPKQLSSFLKAVAEKLDKYETTDQYVDDEAYIIKHD
jgi:hypothetical protein